MTPAPKPVELEIIPSRLMLAWILTVHSVVLLLLALSPLSGWLQLVAVVYLLLMAGLGYRKWTAPKCLVIKYSDGGWALRTKAGNREAELIDYLALGCLLVLTFRTDGGRYAIPLLPDSCSATQLRQLRQLLFLGQVNFSGQ